MKAWEAEPADSVRRVELARARSLLHAATSERDFQRTVVELAQRRRWRVFHDHDSRRNASGLPDLILVRPPRLVFVELKAMKGRLRPEQEAWLDELGRCTSVEAFCWRPDEAAQAQEALL